MRGSKKREERGVVSGRQMGKREDNREKDRGREGAMGSRRSSWHAADGSSITVSPPSGGRSEELPSPSSLLPRSWLFQVVM